MSIKKKLKQITLSGYLAHRVTGHAAGVRLSADDEAKPEPDVADEHDEANQEDQEDGLVVGGSAGLLYLDQCGVMHHARVQTALVLVTGARRS